MLPPLMPKSRPAPGETVQAVPASAPAASAAPPALGSAQDAAGEVSVATRSSTATGGLSSPSADGQAVEVWVPRLRPEPLRSRAVQRYQGLSVLPPPVFSDGTEERHPRNTSPNTAGRLNYYRPFAEDDKKAILWLARLGTTFYKNARSLVGQSVSAGNAHAPAASMGAFPAAAETDCLGSLVLRGQTLFVIPEVPLITVDPHAAVYTLRFTGFPAGYKLFEHVFEVKKDTLKLADAGEQPKLPRIRRDSYLFGHPSGAKFRSPNEFLPHLWWLLFDPQRTKCFCLYCGNLFTRRYLAIGGPVSGSSAHFETSRPDTRHKITPKTPVPKFRRANLKRASTVPAAKVQLLVRSAPAFRIGEVVWARSKTTFVKYPPNFPPGAERRDVSHWPALVLGETRDGNVHLYQVHILKRTNALNEPRVVSLGPERVLPWLALDIQLPSHEQLEAALAAGVADLELFREAVEFVTTAVQCTYHPFGASQLARATDEELTRTSDQVLRTWKRQQHNFTIHAGMWFGTERVLCGELIRLSEKACAGLPAINHYDDQSAHNYLLVKFIHSDSHGELCVTGELFRRRFRNQLRGRRLDDDDDYLFYRPTGPNGGVSTVPALAIMGRYYHRFPEIVLAMGSTQPAPSADRLAVLGANVELRYPPGLGQETEGGEYIQRVMRELAPPLLAGSATAAPLTVTSRRKRPLAVTDLVPARNHRSVSKTNATSGVCEIPASLPAAPNVFCGSAAAEAHTRSTGVGPRKRRKSVRKGKTPTGSKDVRIGKTLVLAKEPDEGTAGAGFGSGSETFRFPGPQRAPQSTSVHAEHAPPDSHSAAFASPEAVQGSFLSPGAAASYDSAQQNGSESMACAPPATRQPEETAVPLCGSPTPLAGALVQSGGKSASLETRAHTVDSLAEEVPLPSGLSNAESTVREPGPVATQTPGLRATHNGAFPLSNEPGSVQSSPDPIPCVGNESAMTTTTGARPSTGAADSHVRAFATPAARPHCASAEPIPTVSPDLTLHRELKQMTRWKGQIWTTAGSAFDALAFPMIGKQGGQAGISTDPIEHAHILSMLPLVLESPAKKSAEYGELQFSKAHFALEKREACMLLLCVDKSSGRLLESEHAFQQQIKDMLDKNYYLCYDLGPLVLLLMQKSQVLIGIAQLQVSG